MPYTQRPARSMTELPLMYTNQFIQRYNSASTRASYLSALRVFADWLQVHSGLYSLHNTWPLDPWGISEDLLVKFKNHMAGQGQPNTSVNARFSAVLTYLAYLEMIDQLPADINLHRIKRLTKRPGRSGSNTAKHVVELDGPRQSMPHIVEYYDRLSTAKLPRREKLEILCNRALMNVLLFTACRVAEVCAIRREQVDGGQDYLIVTGKGDKSRSVFLDAGCKRAIDEYLEARGDDGKAGLFVGHAKNHTLNHDFISRQTVHNKIKKAVKALDLDPRLSAHDFRHYRAVDLLRRGLTLEKLQELLGHVDISTTRNIYAPVIGADIMKEAILKLGR